MYLDIFIVNPPGVSDTESRLLSLTLTWQTLKSASKLPWTLSMAAAYSVVDSLVPVDNGVGKPESI
jgi:hypothetical protein